MNDASAVTHRAKAWALGERFDVRKLERADQLAAHPPVFRVGDAGAAVVLRFGVVVFFDVDDAGAIAFLERVRPLLGDAYASPTLDEAVVQVGVEDQVTTDAIMVVDLSPERLQVVAEALGRSVALDRYENEVRAVVDTVEQHARALETFGAFGRVERTLARMLGSTLLMEERLVGRVEVRDKPDVLWDRPDLERLFQRLVDEYELEERGLVLERKLSLVSTFMNTLLSVVQNRKAARLEWYIIGLIVAEIAITVGTLAFGLPH